MQEIQLGFGVITIVIGTLLILYRSSVVSRIVSRLGLGKGKVALHAAENGRRCLLWCGILLILFGLTLIFFYHLMSTLA